MSRNRNPNADNLAMRDQALASLMGAIPGQDFGEDPLAGEDYADFGSSFGLSVYDPSANIGGFGGGFGGFGWDYGADAPAAPVNPVRSVRDRSPQPLPAHPAAMQAAWQAHNARQTHTARRESLLSPNAGSDTNVERYSFSLPTALVLNTASAINTTLQPNTTLRPQRVLMNAPASNFVLISSLQIANVNVFVGGTEDAVNYNNQAMGVMLDLPTLEPANRVTVTGNYTGFVPPGYANGFAFTFITTLQGPATIAGGRYN